MKNTILSLIIFLGISEHNFATDNVEKKSTMPSTSYTLPQEVDRDGLIKNCVIVTCAEKGNIGTLVAARGFGISDRFILTAAHNIGAYALENTEYQIQCFAVQSAETNFVVPLSPHYWDDGKGNILTRPNFSACNTLRELIITQIYFHPQTHFQNGYNEPKKYNLIDLLEKCKEDMKIGTTSAEQLDSKGIGFTFIKSGKQCEGITFGPDVAILECKEPHGLPTLEISNPINQERGPENKTLLHILGLTGKRYRDEDPAKIIGGGLLLRSGLPPTFQFQPRIIGQRFKILPANLTDNTYLWVNRPFMRTQNHTRFLMEDEVFPGSPDGFGLIASGDSGSGAIIIEEGKASLVALASAGYIQDYFMGIHNYLNAHNFNKKKLREEGSKELLDFYNKSCKIQNSVQPKDRDKKWFITQSLTDVTHIKPWIMSITSKPQ